jgi:hypothetical protein
MRRLPGSTAFSIFSAALLVGVTSCGLRTTLDDDPGASGQTATNTGTSTGKIDASAPGSTVTPDAAVNPPGKTDAPPGTVTPSTPDAAQPPATTPDASVIIRFDTRAGTPTTPDATLQLPEVGNVLPGRGDASVGTRTDLGLANRDAGAPPTPVTRDAGVTPPRAGADAGPIFTGPDAITRIPGGRDAGIGFPTTGIDAGFATPFAIDGGFTFGGGRTRPDAGRTRGAGGQN